MKVQAAHVDLQRHLVLERAVGEFLDDVDFFCISDNYWLGKTKPCLTHGLRGMAYFQLSVRCCEQDLHSGVSFMQLLGIDLDLPFDLHFPIN